MEREREEKKEKERESDGFFLAKDPFGPRDSNMYSTMCFYTRQTD